MYDNVFIAGDLNAQTAELLDYTENDDFLTEMFELDNTVSSYFDKKNPDGK
jgi:hypothetical protein